MDEPTSSIRINTPRCLRFSRGCARRPPTASGPPQLLGVQRKCPPALPSLLLFFFVRRHLPFLRPLCSAPLFFRDLGENFQPISSARLEALKAPAKEAGPGAALSPLPGSSLAPDMQFLWDLIYSGSRERSGNQPDTSSSSQAEARHLDQRAGRDKTPSPIHAVIHFRAASNTPDAAIVGVNDIHFSSGSEDRARQPINIQRVPLHNNKGTAEKNYITYLVCKTHPRPRSSHLDSLGSATCTYTEETSNTNHAQSKNISTESWGHEGVVVRLLTFHLGEPGSIPGGVAPGFPHVGIVPDDAAGQWVFSGISRFLPALSFRWCSIPLRFFLIGTQNLDVKSRPNLFTHCTTSSQKIRDNHTKSNGLKRFPSAAGGKRNTGRRAVRSDPPNSYDVIMTYELLGRKKRELCELQALEWQLTSSKDTMINELHIPDYKKKYVAYNFPLRTRKLKIHVICINSFLQIKQRGNLEQNKEQGVFLLVSLGEYLQKIIPTFRRSKVLEHGRENPEKTHGPIATSTKFPEMRKFGWSPARIEPMTSPLPVETTHSLAHHGCAAHRSRSEEGIFFPLVAQHPGCEDLLEESQNSRRLPSRAADLPRAINHRENIYPSLGRRCAGRKPARTGKRVDGPGRWRILCQDRGTVSAARQPSGIGARSKCARKDNLPAAGRYSSRKKPSQHRRRRPLEEAGRQRRCLMDDPSPSTTRGTVIDTHYSSSYPHPRRHVTSLMRPGSASGLSTTLPLKLSNRAADNRSTYTNPAGQSPYSFNTWGRGGAVVRLLALNQGEPGFHSRRGHSLIFACGNRAWRYCWSAGVFSGIYRFSRSCIPALQHTHLTSSSLPLKTTTLRAAIYALRFYTHREHVHMVPEAKDKAVVYLQLTCVFRDKKHRNYKDDKSTHTKCPNA
ncbi:hypothetical protein PR048_024297 [Dryococelus australis]|uniref:Uncharacterized protein n=1 Tax=Dryococelus australis TaxID=614101 RepID=A0ABQ9GNA3_9NEOP|nr:hypothetical protein PR048_024297 [Dryococelus australis]